MRYRYFISYAHPSGFGSTEIHRDQPITGHADIAALCNQMAAHLDCAWTVVLNFQQYTEPRTAFDE